MKGIHFFTQIPFRHRPTFPLSFSFNPHLRHIWDLFSSHKKIIINPFCGKYASGEGSHPWKTATPKLFTSHHETRSVCLHTNSLAIFPCIRWKWLWEKWEIKNVFFNIALSFNLLLHERENISRTGKIKTLFILKSQSNSLNQKIWLWRLVVLSL